MPLVVTERLVGTHLASRIGKEFTEEGTFGLSSDELLAWIRKKRKGEGGLKPQSAKFEVDDKRIVLSFLSDAGIAVSQLVIECNEEDKERLVGVLSEACK